MLLKSHEQKLIGDQKQFCWAENFPFKKKGIDLMSNSTRQCILFVIFKNFLGKNNIFYACYYQLLFRVWRTSIMEL